MKFEPINPAPPVTTTLMTPDSPPASVPASPRPRVSASPRLGVPPSRRLGVSFVLRLPVVVQPGIVVRNSSLICGVVEPISDIDQNRRIATDDLVPVSHPRRNQKLPRLQGPDEQRVARPERLRPRPQVEQADLKLASHRHPQIALLEMIVQGL